MNKGKFIVFEGIDGSGKSSLVQDLTKEFTENDLKVKNFFEPTNYEHGKVIREFLQKKKSLTKEQLIELFLLDRKDSLEKNILPNLDNGYTVLLDRYFYSMAAYQSDENYSPEKIIKLNLEQGFPIPDLVIYLDLKPEIALKRTNKRGEAEIFETLDFLNKVKESYLKILPYNSFIADAEKDKKKVMNRVKKEIIKLI